MSAPQPARAAATPDLEDELVRIAWRVERWIDPGPAAVVAGAAVAAVAASLLMPWSGGAAGWQILTGHVELGPLPQLCTVVAAVGLLVSVAALLTRFWPLAWAAATCTAIGTVTGLWAVWARQTGAPDADIGPGLVVTVLGTCVLFATWARIVVAARTHVPGAPPA